MVNIISCTPAAPRRSEILRYAGVKAASPETEALLESCLREFDGKLTCRICYSLFPVSREGCELDLGFARCRSKLLFRHLENCGEIILFAATLGLEPDRIIYRRGSFSPAGALMLQAIGTERIEALCDEFCRIMAEKYGSVTSRFSPGYGDLPLELQKDVFSALECGKNIGLNLNESLSMSPSKSVTAIIGIGGKSQSGCGSCSMNQCLFRSEDK